ncbi:hypothetical protein ACFLZL_04600 [Thermodesulfobacteriota bacterium]
MSFKENLIKKITLDKLAHKAARSLTPRDGISTIDADTMKQLLDFSPYGYRRVRDLDLYVLPADSTAKHILVLDNGLALYHTTVEDVIIRKSPTIKEMLNIKNAIRILNDSDVLISKKEDSIKKIHQECIDQLDLSFAASDIESLAKEGEVALAIENAEGVRECLSLFAELLGYTPEPKAFHVENTYMICNITKTGTDHTSIGAMVIYHLFRNTLTLIDNLSDIKPEKQFEFIGNLISGKKDASAEGPNVFVYLKDQVAEQMP